MCEATADENAKLSEFQLDLVQLSAAFNGDHKNESYPDKVIENMTVGEAVKYTKTCFKGFFEGWKKSFTQKVVSIFACNKNEEMIDRGFRPYLASASAKSQIGVFEIPDRENERRRLREGFRDKGNEKSFNISTKAKQVLLKIFEGWDFRCRLRNRGNVVENFLRNFKEKCIMDLKRQHGPTPQFA
ncbi:hypothetical protein Scep_014283 [Stephania cephalantha]|uniref:Uncharacterized protein n=1 Tax=Stephania cephalantha TaxID=152367 RepID=A0AAP0NZ94_9MAGN